MEFASTPRTDGLAAQVRQFFEHEVLPRNRAWRQWSETRCRDPEWLEGLREKARAAGLWNLGVPGLPDDKPGQGLSNLAFAPIAEIMGRLTWAPVVFNCQPPDLPNMITLLDWASPEQRERWLDPLLEGRIRSAFAMTEPAVASSDARNIALRITRTQGGFRLNGRKWYASGAGHPDCAFVIVLGALEGAERSGHTAVIVPAGTPGMSIGRELTFMGWHDRVAPMTEIDFADVEVPANALLGGEGQGFAVAQSRLGPARLHHCMRAIGLAEVIQELMMTRAGERRTFGRDLIDYDTIQGWIARSRIEIEQARLLVMNAAWKLDQVGFKQAWRDVSLAKVAVPSMLQTVTDRAVQLFGALGGSDDTPLHAAHAWARAFRIFDGPDEVHLRQIFKQEARPARPLSESPYMYR